MAILCSCRIITTDDVKLAAATCLRSCEESPCRMGRKQVKRQLTCDKGAPTCDGCAASLNDAVEAELAGR
jgi:hypothetical protein